MQIEKSLGAYLLPNRYQHLLIFLNSPARRLSACRHLCGYDLRRQLFYLQISRRILYIAAVGLRMLG
jgi:hypothetical protein